MPAPVPMNPELFYTIVTLKVVITKGGAKMYVSVKPNSGYSLWVYYEYTEWREFTDDGKEHSFRVSIDKKLYLYEKGGFQKAATPVAMRHVKVGHCEF